MRMVLAKGHRRGQRGCGCWDGLGSRPGLAHNDWGLPLVGGLVGGYALSGMMHQRRAAVSRADGCRAGVRGPGGRPGCARAAASTASSIEHQLNVLDDLAAKGYITKDEYQSRRQALLDQL